MNLLSDAALGPAHVEVLGRARFFSGLDRRRVARVAALGRTEQYPADTRIYSLGDPAGDFYVLADGRVRFTLGVGRHEASAGEINRCGDVFGWAALVETTQRRIATACALTVCEVVAIRTESLTAYMASDPKVGYHLMKQLVVLLTSDLVAFMAG